MAVVVTVPPTVQVLEMVVDLAPAVVGFALSEILQVPPEAATSELAHPSVTILKSVVFDVVGIEHPVAIADPELVNVIVCELEFAPTRTLPKS